MIERDVADHQDAAEPVGEIDELRALGRIEGQRLLDEDVPAGDERGARELEMRCRRCRDHDGFDALVVEDGVEGGGPQVRGHARERARVGIMNGPDLPEVGQHAEEVLPPRSDAEQCDPATTRHSRDPIRPSQ